VNWVADQSAATEGPSDALDRLDRGMLYCFDAVRTVHLAQGLICLVAARGSYRNTRRAALVLVGATVESVWLGLRGMRRGALNRTDAAADVAVSTAGLVVLASCLVPEDRTASVNWMLPYSVGSCLAVGVTMHGRVGLAAAGGLSAIYIATVRDSVRLGGARSAAAVANAASYVGFFAVADVVNSYLKRIASQLDLARRQAIARGERLAAERERNRQHRLLHDTALQALEAVAGDWLTADAAKARARVATGELRRVLRGEDLSGMPGGLSAMMEALALECANDGLVVELVTGDMNHEPRPVVAVALRDAAREALTNVLKHAGTARAVVHISADEQIAALTVRDHGRGFDPNATPNGFGLPESVAARMIEVGGAAEVWSQPGRGTRVHVWGPS
jgi:signal transduction histidine kinase